MNPRALLDHLEAGVAAIGPDWTIVEWSAAAARMTGLAADRVLGQTFWTAFPLAQTTQIGKNTDGNFAKVFAELQAWKLEAEKLRAENQALRETHATLKETIAPLLTPPVIVTQAPPAISAPGGRRADDNAEKKGP